MQNWPLWQQRVLKGVRAGITLGILLSLLAAALYAVRGFQLETRNRLTLIQVVLCYTTGGALGGMLGGFLVPLLERRGWTPVVGFLVVFPFFTALALSMMERTEWFPAGLVIAAICSLLFGSGLGTVIVHDLKRHGLLGL